MYAIVEFSGKQYKVEKGSLIYVDKPAEISESASNTIVLDKVLMRVDGENVTVGQPYISNSKVTALNLGLMKGAKVRGIKFKKRKNYTRTLGHRQEFMQLKIQEI